MYAAGARILLAGLQVALSLKAQGWVWDTSLALPGCENLAVDGAYLWVFSYDRLRARQDSSVYGVLYRFEASAEQPFLRVYTPGGRWYPFELSYHAPHLWFFHGSPERPTEVWQWRWDGKGLLPVRSWRHPYFVSLQALWPLDSTRFMVANDRLGRARWHLVLGFFIRRVHSTLLYCEGDSCWRAARGIPYATGLAYLPAQQEWWVSVAMRKAIWVYQEIGGPRQLRLIRKIRLPGYPDNLALIDSERVWVVCHPSLMRWARSLAFGGKADRWQIVEIRLTQDGRYAVETLYKAPPGYPTASVARPVGGYIYVGNYQAPYLLRLRAVPPSEGPGPK